VARPDQSVQNETMAKRTALQFDPAELPTTHRATATFMSETQGTGDAAYDAWFRAEVQAALDDPRPAMPHDEVEAYFASRRDAARRKTGARGT